MTHSEGWTAATWAQSLEFWILASAGWVVVLARWAG